MSRKINGEDVKGEGREEQAIRLGPNPEKKHKKKPPCEVEEEEMRDVNLIMTNLPRGDSIKHLVRGNGCQQWQNKHERATWCMSLCLFQFVCERVQIWSLV